MKTYKVFMRGIKIKILLVINLFIIGLLFSCSNNEIEKFNNSDENKSISFYSLRNKVTTKYANDNESTYQVYAIIDNASLWYFNTLVTPTASTSTDALDTTEKTYYWPGTTNVYFYAYSPSKIESETGIISIDATTPPDINIDYTVPTSANIDFTIATPVNQAASADGSSSTVALTFRHMLTKIDISLALSSVISGYGYVLESGYTTELTVPYNSGTTNAGADSAIWKMGDVNISTYSDQSSYIIMPQTFTDTNECSFQIQNVVIKRNNAIFFSGDLKTITLSATDIDNATFLPGYQYNFIVTITDLAHDTSGDPIFNGLISFESDLNDWENVDPYIIQP